MIGIICNMLAAVAHWCGRLLVMTEVEGSSPVIGNDVFICYFITCKQSCEWNSRGL